MAVSENNLRDPNAITGRTVLMWLLGFFAVVFIANGIFIYFALGSFPGVAVDSSYEAGQAYNAEIAAAKAQAELDWDITADVLRTAALGAQVNVLAKDERGADLNGLKVDIILRHPTNEAGDIAIALLSKGPGTYAADLENVAAGNWDLVLKIEKDGKHVFRSENRVFLKD